jgi:hypothetical protein
MSRISPFVRGMAILVVIALAIVILNQETALATAGALIRVAFFIAIAVAVYMFWRDFGRREISIWPTRSQRIFYGAAGLLVVDLGWFFAVSLSGRDALVCFVVGAACVYAGVRTWRDQRKYS